MCKVRLTQRYGYRRKKGEDQSMPSAATIRVQIETALARKIPSALTPVRKVIRPVAPTGVSEVDALLEGGLPVGAITEMVGAESSGRTSLALSFLASTTRTGSVGAWIDVLNTLDPESAAAAGVDLSHMLWVRCGSSASKARPAAEYRFALPEKYFVAVAAKKGLHGGGCGGHPRGEVKGLSDAVGGLLRPEAVAPRCAEPQRRERHPRQTFEPVPFQSSQRPFRSSAPTQVTRIDQALRVVDLLLQAGGFGAIVLDLGSIAPEYASRVPL